MLRDEILENIRSLANSQGSYGSMYERLIKAKEEDNVFYDMCMQELEDEEFKDIIDVIMYLES